MIIATYDLLDKVPEIQGRQTSGIMSTIYQPKSGQAERFYINDHSVQKYVAKVSKFLI